MVQLRGGLAPVMPGCGFKAALAKRVITELELRACSRAPSMASAWPAAAPTGHAQQMLQQMPARRTERLAPHVSGPGTAVARHASLALVLWPLTPSP